MIDVLLLLHRMSCLAQSQEQKAVIKSALDVTRTISETLFAAAPDGLSQYTGLFLYQLVAINTYINANQFLTAIQYAQKLLRVLQTSRVFQRRYQRQDLQVFMRFYLRAQLIQCNVGLSIVSYDPLTVRYLNDLQRCRETREFKFFFFHLIFKITARINTIFKSNVSGRRFEQFIRDFQLQDHQQEQEAIENQSLQLRARRVQNSS